MQKRDSSIIQYSPGLEISKSSNPLKTIFRENDGRALARVLSYTRGYTVTVLVTNTADVAAGSRRR